MVLDRGEAVVELDCSEFTLVGVVKVVMYVVSYSLAFGLACFDIGFKESILMILSDLKFIC